MDLVEAGGSGEGRLDWNSLGTTGAFLKPHGVDPRDRPLGDGPKCYAGPYHGAPFLDGLDHDARRLSCFSNADVRPASQEATTVASLTCLYDNAREIFPGLQNIPLKTL